MKNNPMLDKEFLDKLSLEDNREFYAKVVALDFNEYQLEEIQGVVTQGSISIDGSSAVRRTCSLTIVSNDMKLHDYYWGIRTKFKLFIGQRNRIDSAYEDIIWFPFGIYVVKSFSTAHGVNNYTITIQGSDKMSLLNGDLGGVVMSEIATFDSYTDATDPDNSIKYPLKDIIREAVHTYANEPYHNIVINDLPEYFTETLVYNGTETVYLFYEAGGDRVLQMSLDPDQYVYTNTSGTKKIKISELKESQYFNRILNGIGDAIEEFAGSPLTVYGYVGDIKKNPVIDVEHPYWIAKCEQFEELGYKDTKAVYPDDLKVNVGGTIVAGVLDPIAKMLNDFEYFYDVDGKFVFQRKKTYVNVSWNNIVEDVEDEENTYITDMNYVSPITYSFRDHKLITSFNNAPQISEIKNDFAIWGEKNSANDSKISLHLRYAVDEKPKFYRTYNGKKIFYTENFNPALETEYLQDTAKYDAIYGNREEYSDYKKSYNMIEMPSDWWEIDDWLEYYKYINKKDYDSIKNIKLGYFFTEFTYWNLAEDFWGPGEELWDNKYQPLFCFATKLGEPDNENGLLKFEDGYYRRELLTDVSQNPKIELNDMTSFCNLTIDDLIQRKKDPEYNYYHVYIYKPLIDEKAYKAVKKEIKKYTFKTYLEELNEFEGRIEEKDKIVGYEVDWREVIYQMAVDYRKNQDEDNFLASIAKYNKLYYPLGYTGYEQYYTELEGFWRMLYNPFYPKDVEIQKIKNGKEFKRICHPEYVVKNSITNKSKYKTYKKELVWFSNCKSTSTFNSNTVYYQKAISGGYDSDFRMVEDRENFTKKMFNKNKTNYYIIHFCRDDEDNDDDGYVKNRIYYVKKKTPSFNSKHWKFSALNSPETLLFWFDFLDTQGDIADYSVKRIGLRSKAEKDTAVTGIYYRQVPSLILTNATEDDIPEITKRRQGYSVLRCSDEFFENLSRSSQGKSAYDKLNELISQHVCCHEQATVTTVPVYHLQPNTRIYIQDQKSRIDGEYIINKINFTLGYNGTMSLTVNKYIEGII